MEAIDFSSKHHILLEDEDGLRVPMDQPYFRATPIAPDTWRVLSDGDYSYLLAGVWVFPRDAEHPLAGRATRALPDRLRDDGTIESAVDELWRLMRVA